MLRQVADGVHVHQSELLRNNAVVVQGRAGALLVDPGLTGAEMVCLANDLRELGRPVAAGFATHPDWDHVLWHRDLGDVPRYGTARCAAFMRNLRSDADWAASVAQGLPPEIADDVPLELFGLVTGLPAGTTRIPWDGPRVRIVEHPAHATGHAALLVEERGVLVAGDMLSDLFVPMLDVEGAADPIGDYLVGLREIEAVAGDVDVVVPGHGSVGGAGQARARIDLDRAYVHALRDGRDPDGDPRLGPTVEPGWEWVGDIHTGQVQSLARRATTAR
ncbi:MBL fold metallo-hydrolase [Pseudonocardia lacus]|uniref:MBL fold metallo-hydrolase n=1 Tax=Pseudonocardia lacus TaxID=2835865 RepID=UPI001BDBC8E5|nr:MBL fold metallo-hydrolase [Pseudonocardia lacus]